MVKRTVGALGLLGLVYALSMPAAHAAGTPTVLWMPDLSTGKLVGPTVNGKELTIFTQGVNPQATADAITNNTPGGKPFVVVTKDNFANEVDNGCSCDRTVGWLDDGDMDGVGDGTGSDTDPDLTARVYPGELLTGDPTWTDVSIEARMDVPAQNGGTGGFVLRATPKTKKEDPDSAYVLLYTSSDEGDLQSMIDSGIKPASGQVKDQDGTTDRTIDMRILKVVTGADGTRKWTLLAEQGADTSKVYIPRINTLGVDHDANTDPNGDSGNEPLTGYYFRFTAKGNVLTGDVSKDGKTWGTVLTATDDELKAGQVGFFDYGFHILHKEILAQTAP